MSRADPAQELLGVAAEHGQQHQLLLARGQTLGPLADVLGGGRVADEGAARCEELDRALHDRVDRLRRRPVAALHERPELVDHGAVATCLEDVQERLGGEDLADRAARGGQRASPRTRPTSSRTSSRRSAAAFARRWTSSAATSPAREVVLRGAHGDARRDLGYRLVPDVLVDHVRGLPRLPGSTGGSAEALEGLGERFAGDPVEGERERVDGRRDEIGAGVDRRQRSREPHPGRALDVEADGEPARLGDACDELLRAVRHERARRVVEDHTVAPCVGSSRASGRSCRSRPCARGWSRPWRGRAERAAGARDGGPASRRFETSLSGSWSRNTSMPFSAAEATNRLTMSALTGLEPTRKRPRSAIPSGVDTRAAIALIRSQGSPRAAAPAASKTPPPDTSRQANPAPSRISATWRISAVGNRPASGSCESRRSSCRRASARLWTWPARVQGDEGTPRRHGVREGWRSRRRRAGRLGQGDEAPQAREM